MARQTKAEKAVDIFMQSIDALPGNYNAMVVLHAGPHTKAKSLMKTRIVDLPTQILRDPKEDAAFREARESFMRKAFSALFKGATNAFRQRPIRFKKQSRTGKKTARRA